MQEQKDTMHVLPKNPAFGINHQRDNAEQKKTRPLQPLRPSNNDRNAWQIFWRDQGHSWRTEPEISPERQELLKNRCATPIDIGKGIYPFVGMKLDRADIEWLLIMQRNRGGPLDQGNDQQREVLDIRGADLSGNANKRLDLSYLPLAHLLGGPTLIEILKRSEKYLERVRINLEKANLVGVQLKGANLNEAQLEGADLFGAQLEGANLSGAQLEGADLFGAQLEGANFTGAQLERADLSRAQLEGARLNDVLFSGNNVIGPFLADVRWGNTNLAVVTWAQVTILGEEDQARREEKEVPFEKNKIQRNVKKGRLLKRYQRAVRANRQLAVALQGQGLNEDAVHFAYRANLLQRKVLWYQAFLIQEKEEEEEARHWYDVLRKQFDAISRRTQKFGSYLFSLFLDVLAGYGYKPGRTLGWYLLVILGFALGYALLGHLAWWPDALVYSLTSFHGRGFLPGLNGETITLHSPLVVLAAGEAVIGLLVELSFIATFTQRFFGK